MKTYLWYNEFAIWNTNKYILPSRKCSEHKYVYFPVGYQRLPSAFNCRMQEPIYPTFPCFSRFGNLWKRKPAFFIILWFVQPTATLLRHIFQKNTTIEVDFREKVMKTCKVKENVSLRSTASICMRRRTESVYLRQSSWGARLQVKLNCNYILTSRKYFMVPTRKPHYLKLEVKINGKKTPYKKWWEKIDKTVINLHNIE